MALDTEFLANCWKCSKKTQINDYLSNIFINELII